jgi:hypothetical protein
MTTDSWKFWTVALGLWAFYGCWHIGYQSGYVDGHETAWKMYQPPVYFRELASTDGIPDPGDASELENH